MIYETKRVECIKVKRSIPLVIYTVIKLSARFITDTRVPQQTLHLKFVRYWHTYDTGLKVRRGSRGGFLE
jgi:hypothetical protein